MKVETQRKETDLNKLEEGKIFFGTRNGSSRYFLISEISLTEEDKNYDWGYDINGYILINIQTGHCTNKIYDSIDEIVLDYNITDIFDSILLKEGE